MISIIEKQNYYFLGSDPIVIPPELIYSNNAHDEKLKMRSEAVWIKSQKLLI
ncbi:MAG: hypothetical protein R3A12_08495 [Ignavibacteria bacterium]